jgi:hypothetical protein
MTEILETHYSGISDSIRQLTARLGFNAHALWDHVENATLAEKKDMDYVHDELKRILRDDIAPCLQWLEPQAVSTSINLYV